jgi:hypothetical protein
MDTSKTISLVLHLTMPMSPGEDTIVAQVSKMYESKEAQSGFNFEF